MYKIELGRYDADFFRREVQDRPNDEERLPTPDLLSHKRIRAAWKYFDAKFTEEYARILDGKTAYEWALRIQRVLTEHLSVVEVRSADEDNAAEVFETLNYRGIDLSTTDLLRNLVLRRSNDNDREEINDSWENIFQLEDHVEEFLRHWWLSVYGDLTGRGLFKAFKPKVIDGELTPIGLTRQLDSSATIYQAFLDGRDTDQEVAKLLQDIKELGAKLLYPVLLSTYSTNYEADRKRIIKSLLTLFVRYNIISGLEGTRLEPAVYSIAREMRIDNAVPYVDRMRIEAPNDEKFSMDFKVVDIQRQATARYLLREIENARQPTDELRIQGGSKVHLDHIYPQKPREGYRDAVLDAALNRLGNLTLLSGRINQSFKNAPFTEKRARYAESQLRISQEVSNYMEWNMTSIDQRQAGFAEESAQIWTFPE